MWPEWLRSPTRTPSSSPRPPPSPRTRFSCSSFKDLQTILTDEPDPGSIPSSPKRPSVFHRVGISTSVLRAWAHRHKPPPPPPPPLHNHIVLYFTTLRIVRRTYEDCRAVRSILRGFRVPIDERDLSMDGSYVDELQSIFGTKKLTLPVVFIGGKYVGGTEKIKELHETGELNKIIGGLPFVEKGGGCGGGCNVCGGLRFIVCEECNGSHKIYSEKCGFRSCAGCNVNGLVRCPSCFSVPTRRMFSIL